MPSMFDDMYIPWTPRLFLKKKKTPPPPPEPQPKPEPKAAPKPKDLCASTLYVARAIITQAVEPFPEVARAIGAAFLAFHRGELNIDVKGIFAATSSS